MYILHHLFFVYAKTLTCTWQNNSVIYKKSTQKNTHIIPSYCKPLMSPSHKIVDEVELYNFAYNTNSFIKLAPTTEDCFGSQITAQFIKYSEIIMCGTSWCVVLSLRNDSSDNKMEASLTLVALQFLWSAFAWLPVQFFTFLLRFPWSVRSTYQQDNNAGWWRENKYQVSKVIWYHIQYIKLHPHILNIFYLSFIWKNRGLLLIILIID